MATHYYVRNDGQPMPKGIYFPSKEELGLKKTESITEDRKGQLNLENRDEDKNRPALNNRIYWLDEKCERQEKALDYGEYYAYSAYPHICKWDDNKRQLVGVIVGNKGSQKRYFIKAGEIVEVENMMHLKELMERYRFLNEVNKDGSVIITKNMEGYPYEMLGKDGVKEEFKQMAQKAGIPTYRMGIQ